jgi:hypothetical protein
METIGHWTAPSPGSFDAMTDDDDKHEGTPRDRDSEEPLGPVTPDPEVPLGDTAEAHDEIVPQDLPLDHPGRKAAEQAAEEKDDGTTRGNR